MGELKFLINKLKIRINIHDRVDRYKKTGKVSNRNYKNLNDQLYFYIKLGIEKYKKPLKKISKKEYKEQVKFLKTLNFL